MKTNFKEKRDKVVKMVFRVMPKNEEKSKWGIICGKSLATEKEFDSEKEAYEYLSKPRWDLVLTLISEMIDLAKEKEEILKNMEELK